jgi:hypothetical protein
MNEVDPETQRPRLLLLAERLLSIALTGDIAAIKEIDDRLDGKPAKAVIGDADWPIFAARFIGIPPGFSLCYPRTACRFRFLREG